MKFLDELKDTTLVGLRVRYGPGKTTGTVMCRYRENVKVLWDDNTVSFYNMRNLEVV